jgi:hypothetical protein
MGASCGDDLGAAPDGGLPTGYTLEVLDPPGDSIGLPYSQGVTLRVRYLDDRSLPISAGAVNFAIVAEGTTENPGGSTLMSNTAITDELGIAQVELVAGAARVNFRVEVSAVAAPSALFYVAVSDVGFTTLRITPIHDGPRDDDSFDNVQVRLYQPATLLCANIDAEALPESFFPPRSGKFGDTLSFQNLAVNEPYTVVAWGETTPDGAKVALGCAQLDIAQVIGPTVGLSLPVYDRALELPAAIRISSTFGLDSVEAALASELPNDPWDPLACPLGAAQLLIDCTLDAITGDGVMDCVPTGPDPTGLAADVAAQRGAPDANGCRPARAPGDDESIDAQVSEALAAGGWPTTHTTALVEVRGACLHSFDLESELSFFFGSASHQILSASIAAGGTSHSVDLQASARPVLQQSQIAFTAELADLSLDTHAFTLRYGAIAAAVFVARGLAPLGLGSRASDLGSAIVESVDDPVSGLAGCAGLSALLCRTGSHAQNCAQAGCNSARTALDGSLTQWSEMLDGVGLDLALQGSTTLSDPDDNLMVDGIVAGGWQATFTLQSAAQVSAVGSFQSTP